MDIGTVWQQFFNVKDYSSIPTFSEFSEFIEQMHFDLDAKALYQEFSDRGWTTKKGNNA